jgi:hypothetical protein
MKMRGCDVTIVVPSRKARALYTEGITDLKLAVSLSRSQIII